VLSEIKNDKNQVIWSNFVLNFKHQIFSSYNASIGDQRAFKNGWASKFTELASENNLQPIMSRADNWDLIEQAIAPHHPTTPTTPTTPNASTISKSSKSSSTPSNKSKLGQEIAIADKASCIALFKTFENTKMWKLSTGRYVKKVMGKMLDELEFEQ
jgi:hypothetical protein